MSVVFSLFRLNELNGESMPVHKELNQSSPNGGIMKKGMQSSHLLKERGKMLVSLPASEQCVEDQPLRSECVMWKLNLSKNLSFANDVMNTCPVPVVLWHFI
ncbi:hypothetical protein OPV22_012938 [Ensete ventricosum]|uniref:Uncharacterized protein n=1 Tax=Ensete ventricosum TaxID=4639 RepID=A0AAV8R858_ENSVE|nr:hypothetical protein OPV22_012938 [Ensete ventricosum]